MVNPTPGIKRWALIEASPEVVSACRRSAI